MTIRVAIVEDHDDFREGLFHILEATEGFKCVGRFASVEEALRKFVGADVVLMDIGLPGQSGIDGIRPIKAKQPGTQVIMLTVFEDDKHVFEAILAGADGYITKKTPPARVLQSIEEAAAGGMPMTPKVARQIIALLRHYVPTKGETFSLTRRELEIVNLLVEGLNYGMIAERIFISRDTVRNHIRHIYEKLHVHSKSQAVAKALKQSIV
jgi:DNA-binding NarL/FixJ family response regulator